jgi:hypothetical protein
VTHVLVLLGSAFSHTDCCVSGLDLCVKHSLCDAATLTMLQLEKSAARENLVIIRVHDLNSLADECCVNDCKVQFWFR